MNQHPPELGGIVLCGGQSRRMGQPKAWLDCGGEHLLQRVVRLVAAAVGPVVVANSPGQDIPPLPDGVQIVLDAPDAVGPLAGIAAGFSALAGRCTAAFVVACDHPLLRPGFISRLAGLLEDELAAVPSHHGRLHPLAALYSLQTHAILTQLIHDGERRATTFAERCQPKFVQAADLADCDPQLDSLRNFNDPASYAALLEDLPG